MNGKNFFLLRLAGLMVSLGVVVTSGQGFASEPGAPFKQYPPAIQAQMIQNQLASNHFHEMKNRKRKSEEIQAEIAELKREQSQSVFKNPRALPDLFRRERKLRAELKGLEKSQRK